MMTIAEEIASSLRSMVDVTWTAKQLYAIISHEDMQFNREGKLLIAES